MGEIYWLVSWFTELVTSMTYICFMISVRSLALYIQVNAVRRKKVILDMKRCLGATAVAAASRYVLSRYPRQHLSHTSSLALPSPSPSSLLPSSAWFLHLGHSICPVLSLILLHFTLFYPPVRLRWGYPYIEDAWSLAITVTRTLTHWLPPTPSWLSDRWMC